MSGCNRSRLIDLVNVEFCLCRLLLLLLLGKVPKGMDTRPSLLLLLLGITFGFDYCCWAEVFLYLSISM